jgi:tetratricopeptide (TPR) repeat protein
LEATYWRNPSTQPLPPSAFTVEGFYLKGQGVVYSITLPTPPPDPAAKGRKANTRALTDWDRMRREVRGQPGQKVENAGAVPRVPNPVDLVLETLAANGHHLKQLGDNESVTVAITFRPPRSGSGWPPVVTFNSTNYQGNNWRRKDAYFPAQSPSGKSASPARDYELLGDLHLRQGKPAEALAAYKKALDAKAKGQQAAEICRKMARAYLALKDDAGARKALDQLGKYLKNTRQEGKANGKPARKTSAHLPAKVVISVSKKLLDQAGQKKITPNQFRKEASVEYLNFPQAK